MKLERHHTIFDGTIISDCAEFEFRNVRSRFIHSSWWKVSYSVNVEKKPRIELWLNLWNNETLNWTLIETLMNVLFSLTQLRWGSMILRDELMILMSIFQYNHLPTASLLISPISSQVWLKVDRFKVDEAVPTVID